MVGGSSAGSAAGANFYFNVATSETDGDTLDGDAEFEEYEEWDYAEMLATMYVACSHQKGTDLRLGIVF